MAYCGEFGSTDTDDPEDPARVDAREEAAEWWNRRPLEDAQAATIAALRAELAEARDLNAKQAVLLYESVAKMREIVAGWDALIAEWNSEGDGWISVSERLPPWGIWVLCYVADANSFGVDSVSQSGNWYTCDNVTHWREIAPPSEVSQ